MRVPIFKRTAAILLRLCACVLYPAVRRNRSQPIRPESGWSSPAKTLMPEEVLRSYLACLQCGDSVTYMKLFADKNAALVVYTGFSGAAGDSECTAGGV